MRKITAVNLAAALLCLGLRSFGGVSSPAEKPVVLYFHGGAMFSYVNDKISIYPDGGVRFESLSPFPYDWKSQNTIGTFNGRIEPSKYASISGSLGKRLKAGANPRTIPHDAVLGELYFEGDEKNGVFWAYGDEDSSVKELLSHLAALKKAASRPVKALALNCSVRGHHLSCDYVNVGRETVTTVDPLGVSNSVFCLDKTGRRTPLHRLNDYDPRKMVPKIVTIRPKGKFGFSLNLGRACAYKIVVKTTDMLINPSYGGCLLGELVSNDLNK